MIPEANQKKVDLYLRIMEELHGQSELSEIHINDAVEVSVDFAERADARESGSG